MWSFAYLVRCSSLFWAIQSARSLFCLAHQPSWRFWRQVHALRFVFLLLLLSSSSLLTSAIMLKLGICRSQPCWHSMRWVFFTKTSKSHVRCLPFALSVFLQVSTAFLRHFVLSTRCKVYVLCRGWWSRGRLETSRIRSRPLLLVEGYPPLFACSARDL